MYWGLKANQDVCQNLKGARRVSGFPAGRGKWLFLEMKLTFSKDNHLAKAILFVRPSLKLLVSHNERSLAATR